MHGRDERGSSWVATWFLATKALTISVACDIRAMEAVVLVSDIDFFLRNLG